MHTVFSQFLKTDQNTLSIVLMSVPENKWTAFYEPNETINDDFTTFKTAFNSIMIPNAGHQN